MNEVAGSSSAEQLRRLETLLEEASTHRRAVFEAMVDALVEIDEQGVIRAFNHAAETMFGWAASEALGRNVSELMPEPMAGDHDGYIRHHMRTGEKRIIGTGRETYARRRNGSVFPIDLSVGRFQAGGETAFIGIIRDLTKARAVEAALRSRQVELQAMYEQAPVAIATCDVEGILTGTNEAFSELAGVPPGGLPGGSLADLLGEPARATHTEGLRQLRSGRATRLELALVLDRPDGERREIAAHYAIVRLDDTRRMVVVHVFDRTAQVTAEREARAHRERLAHVDRLATMGELASGIAHEVNQPLTAISAYARACERLYQTGMCQSAEFEDALSQIVAQASRAGEVVHRLRNFARRGEFTAIVESVPALIEAVLSLLQPDLRQAEVLLEQQIEPGLPEVRVDTVQIQQVIVNLVRNAIESMHDVEPARRVIAIHAGRLDSGELAISVTDRGGGVAPEVVESLFDPFSTSKPSGMGLGLAISKSIVEAHGGRLWYESVAEGGTRFTLTVPVPEGGA